jgi:hypothetical protein
MNLMMSSAHEWAVMGFDPFGENDALINGLRLSFD